MSRCHLKVVNLRDEILIDQDVNNVELSHGRLVWSIWEQGHKDMKDTHEVVDRDLKLFEVTPVSDRLVREPVEE